MPYIDPKLRAKLDEPLKFLTWHVAEYAPRQHPGVANYLVTRLIVDIMRPLDGWSYTSLSQAIAVLSDAAAEMRRRLLDPYEEKIILRNGDIPEYANPEYKKP
jgi:hypothetical protein